VGNGKPARYAKHWLIGVIAFGSIAATLLIFHFYHDRLASIREQQGRALLTIAEVKVAAIDSWRRERISDGRVMSTNTELGRFVRRFLDSPGASARAELPGWVEQMRSQHAYSAVRVFDASGRLRLSSPPAPPALMGGSSDFAVEAIRQRKVVFEDFHAGADGPIHLGVFAPLLDGGAEPIGAIKFQIDPTRFLYPHLQIWPTPSKSGETLLVRRDGDQVVYLNELRHRKDTALKLRIPVARADLPAAQAVTGQEGVVEGKDYRGVPVLAALLRIPDSPWFLITKIDRSEAFATLRSATRSFAVITILVVILCGFGVLLAWSRRESKQYLRLYQAETQRARSQEALQRAEAHLLQAQAIARLGSWEVVSPGTPAEEYVWSDEVYKIFGVEKEGFQPGRNAFLCAVHPDDRPKLEAAMARIRSTGRLYEVEHRIVRPDGSVRHVREHAEYAVPDASNVTRMIGIVQDITDYKQLEEQFLQAQKLESLGRLAGGVAHDFNNLLTVINGYGDLLLDSLPEGDPVRDSVSEMRKAGESAAALTGQLLVFSRKQRVQAQQVDLNSALSDSRKMLQRLVGENIQLKIRLEPQLGKTVADPGQVQQVIMNLVVNARDAMPDGGSIFLETANADLDERYGERHPDVKPGSYVMLSVSDTGTGMSEEVKSRIFEPFFTTKPKGMGTGLGLATVYGIVKQSGGWIWVYSETGRGTTFKIYLQREKSCGTPEMGKEVASAADGEATVLLVEDQPEVRKLAAVVLRSHKYTVIEAANAQEALGICKHTAGPIHLLLTDIVLPGLSGPELLEQVKRLYPEIKVLFTSGYTGQAAFNGSKIAADAVFVDKPFTARTLSEKVREALGN
jgi:PAS domain S-box-containing protein